MVIDDSNTSRAPSSVAALKLDSPSLNGVKRISVVLTRARSEACNDNLEINQLIDSLIDQRHLSYINIAAFCLSSLQEKNELLKPLLDGVKKFQGT